jgi:hypothetical protein
VKRSGSFDRSKVTVFTSLNPGAKSILVPFLVFSVLLLALLIGDVVWLMPSKTPEERQNWVSNHQSAKNFITAERMITTLLPASANRWSTQVQCEEIDRGVWNARGQVEINTSWGVEIPISWRAIFVPATSEPLYLIVGSLEKGDFNAALSRAGKDPEKN